MRGVEGSSPPCERPGCDEPAKSNGLCRGHYDREREASRHRHRPEKVLLSRARSRATSELVKAHEFEFKQLVLKHLAEVKEEAEYLGTSAGEAPRPYDGITRLQPGPPSRLDDHGVEDRIALRQPVQCPGCQRYHERGHRCPECAGRARRVAEGVPTREDVIGEMSKVQEDDYMVVFDAREGWRMEFVEQPDDPAPEITADPVTASFDSQVAS